MYDVAILGAGASGLMSAVHLSHKNVALIEANKQVGAKILASGGGKCNVTNKNISVSRYLGDEKFISKILDDLSTEEILEFLYNFNLEVETRKYGQYFFKNSAKYFVALLQRLTRHCDFFYEHVVEKIDFNKTFSIKTNRQTIHAKKVIVATGGMSYKQLGASDIGYKLAKDFGHKIVAPAPALVGFTVQKDEFWMKELSGISFYARLSMENKTLESELLFTHKGISGPLILSGSLYWEKGSILLDFLPNYDLSKILNTKSQKQISSLLPLPKRFTKALLDKLQIKDVQVRKLKKEEKERLWMLKEYSFSPAGTFGFSKAEVTKGGVSTEEIDAYSMESKLQSGLYFVGEVLDVTGELGGYNFHWAFACAKRVAKSV